MILENKVAKNPIGKGLKTLIFFTAIFLVWAIFLPITSASIADGVIVLDFNRKTIQHLEGGIIEEILVKEGQIVKQGDILLYLRDIKVKSEQQILQERLFTMQLQKTRLETEKTTKKILDLSNFRKVDSIEQNKANEIIETQLKLFESRQHKREGEISTLQKKLLSAQNKFSVLQTELKMVKPLVAENNLPLTRQLELEKSLYDLKYEIQASKLQISNYKEEQLSEILKEIKETDLEIITLTNQLEASKDMVIRSEILSPVDGKVMNIKYHTIGAVIPPAAEIMNIVPQNDQLIIEAKVRPQDIDNIAVNMKAKVSLTAYKEKKVPRMNGIVINISPDITIDEQTKESYFLARVKIDSKDIEKMKNKVELYPGMPAQVFIINGSRSLLSYLFTPISDSAYKAFREE